MASAKNLKQMQSYLVDSGPLAGQEVIVLDNTPVPDGFTHQRKIRVQVGDTPTYILPRQINDGSRSAPEPAAAESPHVIVQQEPITDPMDPRLDHYRPDPSILDDYINRYLPGNFTDVDVLLHYWRSGKFFLLVGETQSGKTLASNVLAILAAREKGYEKPYAVLTISGSSSVTDFDMFGQATTYVDEDGRDRLVHVDGVVSIAARSGSFLNLDEVNMFDEQTISSLNSLSDDRRSFVNRQKAVKTEGGQFIPEHVVAHPEFFILGSYNDGYLGAGVLQEAFANRFIHLPWDYDPEVEESLISSPAVRNLAGVALRNAREEGRIRTPVGTRALMELEANTAHFGVEFGVWAFLGMFPARDRSRASYILRDRSFYEIRSQEIEES